MDCQESSGTVLWFSFFLYIFFFNLLYNPSLTTLIQHSQYP